MLVYTLLCSIFNVEITSKMRRLFEFLKSYNNCFDFKNAKFFFEHEDENYAIDLIFGAKSLYESLYILFKTEFNVLKNYLLKNLILNCIQKFTNRVNASMFFVFKRKNNFRLYVDYRKLNVFIIKNRCSFSLIDKTLNYLVNVAYFIKFDFKNIYYRIKIRKNDK